MAKKKATKRKAAAKAAKPAKAVERKPAKRRPAADKKPKPQPVASAPNVDALRAELGNALEDSKLYPRTGTAGELKAAQSKFVSDLVARVKAANGWSAEQIATVESASGDISDLRQAIHRLREGILV